MHVVHTAVVPPNHGRICLAMIGWTRNSRNADRKIVSAYGSTDGRAGTPIAAVVDMRTDLQAKARDYPPEPGGYSSGLTMRLRFCASSCMNGRRRHSSSVIRS